jgi:hypothetical protein
MRSGAALWGVLLEAHWVTRWECAARALAGWGLAQVQGHWALGKCRGSWGMANAPLAALAAGWWTYAPSVAPQLLRYWHPAPCLRQQQAVAQAGQLQGSQGTCCGADLQVWCQAALRGSGQVVMWTGLTPGTWG